MNNCIRYHSCPTSCLRYANSGTGTCTGAYMPVTACNSSLVGFAPSNKATPFLKIGNTNHPNCDFKRRVYTTHFSIDNVTSHNAGSDLSLSRYIHTYIPVAGRCPAPTRNRSDPAIDARRGVIFIFLSGAKTTHPKQHHPTRTQRRHSTKNANKREGPDRRGCSEMGR